MRRNGFKGNRFEK